MRLHGDPPHWDDHNCRVDTGPLALLPQLASTTIFQRTDCLSIYDEVLCCLEEGSLDRFTRMPAGGPFTHVRAHSKT